MWGFPEALAKVNSGKVSPAEIAEATAKREAEQKINEEGRGICSSCKDEIIKNERGFWESASLLEYCTESRDHKHKPRIVWKTNEPI